MEKQQLVPDAPPSYDDSQAAPPYSERPSHHQKYIAQPPYVPGSTPEYPYQQQPGYYTGPQQSYGAVHQNQTSTVIPAPPQQIIYYNVPDYTALSIFSCLCCFWPLGIVAIIKSCEVTSAVKAGNYQQAQSASAMARKLARISISIGCILIIVFIICGCFYYF